MAMTESTNIGTPLTALTPTQRMVANLIAQGRLNKQIAHELGIAEGTVEVHVKTILRRLNVRNRTEIAVIVTRSS